MVCEARPRELQQIHDRVVYLRSGYPPPKMEQAEGTLWSTSSERLDVAVSHSGGGLQLGDVGDSFVATLLVGADSDILLRVAPGQRSDVGQSTAIMYRQSLPRDPFVEGFLRILLHEVKAGEVSDSDFSPQLNQRPLSGTVVACLVGSVAIEEWQRSHSSQLLRDKQQRSQKNDE